MNNATQTQIEELFNLGAHLGHKKNRLHPKARKYVYKIINGVSIIDLTQTVVNLENAKKMMAQEAKESKNILVVATKKLVNQYVTDECKKAGISYITTKWLPGLLTNFEMIIKNVKYLKTLIAQREAGEWNDFIKHERVKLEKKITKLERFYGGLLALEKRPDFLLILDTKKEKNAVKEAKANKLPIIAVMDTNSDPSIVDYPIMINDDSTPVIERVISELLSSYTGK